MENPTEPCTNNTTSEKDKFDVAIFENVKEKDSGDETELRTKTRNNEVEQGHTGKIDKYDPSLDLSIALRKGTRSCTQHSISNYVSYENLSPQFRAFTASLDSTTILKNIHIALECNEWKNAVMEEIQALEKNKTSEICGIPKGHKLVGCKWVYTLKYKADGTLDGHKVRLVAKGCTQTYGVDFSETFSPTAKLNTVRVLLSVAVNKDWTLYQLDVKNVFLNGGLVEEVYMSPLPGFKAQLGMLGCRPIDTPIEFNSKLGNSDDQVLVDKKQYQRIVGKLIFLSNTRLDIFFSVSVVSQFMQGPYEKHMEAVKRILRHLKTTPGKGLMFRKTYRKTIETYTDSDWAGSVVDRKSTSGYCTFVWGNLVAWRSKKQSVMARNSAKVEYRAMSSGICEEICGCIYIPYIPSNRYVADVLTKGLLSAAIITAYLMRNEQLSLEDALDSLRKSNEFVSPNDGFMEQLKLFEEMGFKVDYASPIYKRFRLKVLGESYNRGEKINISKLGADPGLSREVASEVQSSQQVEFSHLRAYRCKKCRRLVALLENVVDHIPGEGETSFDWYKRKSGNPFNKSEESECSSIFVEPLRWMTGVEEGALEGKLSCAHCEARLGYFNWSGIQCSCGSWITPAFQLHKSRVDISTV
ncbi:dual specificity protein phosphatase 12-like [Cucumis melo var. makuwa]|uniref:protein-tyrosine-phosphatase n=1 Tax=Cucumis melo var. makuwa TaxID=1194695 RepID=A0A5D3D5C3_CUCMM|nr:dual specificity protein phosphatase 12-like [Cucumis melo var. makuwa]TYK18746.1 dual specificity protein phosphatase 12-like [Cucumis melo var. makuwa]